MPVDEGRRVVGRAPVVTRTLNPGATRATSGGSLVSSFLTTWGVNQYVPSHAGRAVALTSIMAIKQMKVDIFPKLGAPAIYVAQPYGGMDPSQMEGYLTYYYEYHFLYITGIEHVESKNIQGIALMKLVFHP